MYAFQISSIKGLILKNEHWNHFPGMFNHCHIWLAELFIDLILLNNIGVKLHDQLFLIKFFHAIQIPKNHFF